jgi:hypothetical protein
MAEKSKIEIDSPFLSTDKKVSQMISYLTQSHIFVNYSKKSRRQVSIVYFSENLQKLIFEINKQTRKIVLLSDIYYVESGISKELVLELYKEDLRNLFGFKIVTKKRNIELSAMHKSDRDMFIHNVNLLVSIMKEWNGTNGLRNYFNKKMQGNANSCQKPVRREEDEMERQVIRSLLDDVIYKIELNLVTSNKKKLHTDLKLIEYENKYLTDQHDLLIKKTIEKDKNLELIQTTHTYLKHKFYLRSLIDKFEKTDEKLKIWKKIISFCDCLELKTVAGVSRWYKKLVKNYLKQKNSWKQLCFVSLSPRSIYWDIYFKNFHPMIRVKSLHYNEEVNEEIRKDVIRGLPDRLEDVELILQQICSRNSEVGYCQGMQVVTHFLITVFNDIDKVAKTLNILMEPPYYMGEIWKKGLCRLKLAVYQLEVIVEMKFPFLLEHLKNLELNIETLVTPWIVTIFTQMVYQKQMSRTSLEQIWDMFLVLGWPVLIASCLGMFYLLLDRIMHRNFEETMNGFTLNLPSLTSNTIKKFLVDQKFLEQLETSFNSQLN